MVFLMYVVIMMDNRTVHPCWVDVVWRMPHFSIFLVVAVGGKFGGFHMMFVRISSIL